MRKTLLASLIALTVVCAVAPSALARGRAWGYAAQGGVRVSTPPGVLSTTRVLGSYPLATIDVFLTGTLTRASIFADNLGTPKANPFSADLNGFWFFYADNGRYDVRVSGGGAPAPFTLADIAIIDTAATASSLIFTVNSYGAVGDGKIVYDAAMTNGSAVLGSASARFNCAVDLPGRIVRVEGAGAAGAALSATIASCTDTSHLLLSVAASTSISGREAVWGTDNAAAIQSAVTAMKTGTANGGNGTLVFGGSAGAMSMYLIGSSISFGTFFQGATITSYGFGYVNPDIDSSLPPKTYSNVNIRWAGNDSTPVGMFDFSNGCLSNTISNLGFTTGAVERAIWFHPIASGTTYSHLSGNRVLGCQFWSKPEVNTDTSIGILYGFDPATSDDADMANIKLNDNTFLGFLKYGICLNASSNGYTTFATGNAFYMFGSVSTQRGVYAKAWNTLTIRDSTVSVYQAGIFTDGAYALDLNGAGWFDIENFYSEIPLELIGSMGSFSLAGVTIRNMMVNTSLTSASAAVNMSSGYVKVENSCVSSRKSSLQQRAINAADGGQTVGGQCNNSGVGAAVFDNYTGGKWIREGGQIANSALSILLYAGQYIGFNDTNNPLATNQRRMIGYDAVSQFVNIAPDGTPLSIQSGSITYGTFVRGTTTLVGGTKTVANTTVAAGTIVFTAYVGTPTVTPCSLSYTVSAGVSFTINSSCGADASNVAWFLVN